MFEKKTKNAFFLQTVVFDNYLLQPVWPKHLIQKKNCTSKVWAYFGFEPDQYGGIDDRERPICRLCEKQVGSKDGK